MRRLVLFVALVGPLGCRKSAPTTFVRAISEYTAGTYDTLTRHTIFMFGISPYDTPQVSINGYPVDLYSAWMDGYFVWDSLPHITAGEELSLNLQFKDLNGTDREASAKVKVPPLPVLGDVSLDSLYLTVAWGPPDPKEVDFVLVSAAISCRDTAWNPGFGTYDTLIADLDTIHVRLYVPKICSPYPKPIAHIHAYVTVSFVSGPWSGEKDNVKGVKGQYFALATAPDTVSWNRDTTYHLSYGVPPRDPYRLQRLLSEYFGPPYGE